LERIPLKMIYIIIELLNLHYVFLIMIPKPLLTVVKNSLYNSDILKYYFSYWQYLHIFSQLSISFSLKLINLIPSF